MATITAKSVQYTRAEIPKRKISAAVTQHDRRKAMHADRDRWRAAYLDQGYSRDAALMLAYMDCILKYMPELPEMAAQTAQMDNHPHWLVLRDMDDIPATTKTQILHAWVAIDARIELGTACQLC